MLELTVGPYTNGVRKSASALYDGSHGTRCLMNFDHSIEPWEGVNVILRFFKGKVNPLWFGDRNVV